MSHILTAAAMLLRLALPRLKPLAHLGVADDREIIWPIADSGPPQANRFTTPRLV
jgi:hypothetical protein